MAQARQRPSANARIDALIQITEELTSNGQLDRNAIQSAGQLLLAQQGINVRVGHRLDGHERRLDDQEAAIGRHGRRLASHDMALSRVNNDLTGAREATAVVATQVVNHEERLTVLERLRDRFDLPWYGWLIAVALAFFGTWGYKTLKFPSVMSVEAPDVGKVVFPGIQPGMLFYVIVGLLMFAAAVLLLVIIWPQPRAAASSAATETTTVVEDSGPPQLAVVRDEPVEVDNQPIAASGAPAP